MSNVSLYHFNECPFCVKVRKFIRENTLDIPLHNIRKEQAKKEELTQEGGKAVVPCLRIEDKYTYKVTWLYESNKIIEYLKNNLTFP
tara:strand:+ start:441 stop:701 length:261 start_codon:yes stop_codon:yes gene_type:complete